MLALMPVSDNVPLFDIPLAFDLFDGFFDELSSSCGCERRSLSPEFDVSETDEHIVVKADLPGIDPKDLDIEIVDRMLTLKGSKKEEHEGNGECYHRIERRSGSFSRSILLPDEVEADKIEAAYKDGVLKVTIPKSESARPKKIEVKAG